MNFLRPMAHSAVTAGCFAFALLVTSSASAGALFVGLGVPTGKIQSVPLGVSADGTTVGGYIFGAVGPGVISAEAFRWVSGAGMQSLGDLSGGDFNSRITGVNADGSVVVGFGLASSGFEAFRWTAGTGMVGLGDIPGGADRSFAFGVSTDGLAIAGWGSGPFGAEAFLWTPSAGMMGLGDLPGGDFSSHAYAVSGDGSTVVGQGHGISGYEAFRWTAVDGMQGLGDLPGAGFESEGRGVSADGSVVVGTSRNAFGYEAFRWTAAGGMVGLGDLPGGSFLSIANAVSADGSMIVGRGAEGGQRAFIWDSANGMRNLQTVLVAEFGLDLTGWTLLEATGVSADGRTVVGYGTNPNGQGEAWIAYLEAPANPTPEPASMALLGIGLAGLAGRRILHRRRARAAD